jgi:hypothetical protein
MPVIQKEISVPANGVIDNAVSGSAFEFLRSNAVVSMGVTGQAAGLTVNIQSGADIVLEESDVFVKANYPVIPDEMFYNDVGVMGDRLVIRIRNTTAGAITARVIAVVSPI